jgi:hypothetical protein
MLDYPTFVSRKEAEGHPARAILDQLLAYWHAEQAERDAEADRQMARERDRLERLAASYGMTAAAF